MAGVTIDAVTKRFGSVEVLRGIDIGDQRVNEAPPKQRDIAMVFQCYALYPHMTVRENMAF